MKRLFIYSVIVFAVIGLLLYISKLYIRHHTADVYARSLSNAPYDAIIVPGMPYDTTGNNFLFKIRIYWAKQLYERGIARNIIFSGTAVHSPYVEGKIMALIADSLHIPRDRVFAEIYAEHGKENVYYSWRLAQKLGFKKVALATDPFQSLFLEGFVRHNIPGMGILPIPIDSFQRLDIPLPLVNTSSCVAQNYSPLKERKGFWERMWYTNGVSLPKEPPVKEISE